MTHFKYIIIALLFILLVILIIPGCDECQYITDEERQSIDKNQNSVLNNRKITPHNWIKDV
jgi:hypothetical protein